MTPAEIPTHAVPKSQPTPYRNPNPRRTEIPVHAVPKAQPRPYRNPSPHRLVARTLSVTQLCQREAISSRTVPISHRPRPHAPSPSRTVERLRSAAGALPLSRWQASRRSHLFCYTLLPTVTHCYRLRGEVISFVHRNVTQQCRMLDELSVECTKALLMCLIPSVCLQNNVLLRTGELCEYVYILQQGSLRIEPTAQAVM